MKEIKVHYFEERLTNGITYWVGVDEFGTFISATGDEPYFLCEGITEDQVVEKAEEAIDYFLENIKNA